MLSFDAIWNDQSFAGGMNKFKINYYLADDKVEVKEIHEPNNGKSPFPLLLKKSRLPKSYQMSHCPGMLKEAEDYYKAQDFLLGSYVNVYNREFLLLDCDFFTKDYFSRNFGIEQKKVDFEPLKSMKTYPKPKIPPHNGFGSELDSLGNCFNLIPKPPKIDLAKKFIYNRVILRFVCRMISTNKEDNLKQFILSFSCGDDNIMIFLKTGRNSGIQGGKFLEKNKYKNDNTGKYYCMKDLYMGQVLNLNKMKFQIISADDYTLNFMFQKPDLFPECNISKILDKIKPKFAAVGDFTSFSEKFIQNVTENQNRLTFEETHLSLNASGIDNQFHENFVLFYLCNSDVNNTVSLKELLGIVKERIYTD